MGSYSVGYCGFKVILPCSAVIDTGKRDIWVPYTKGTYLRDILYDSVSTLQMYVLRLSFCGNSEVN